MTVEVTADNFEKLKNGDLPLVVDLWATWCGPCRMVGPIMEELSNEYEGKVVVGKCDIEENEDIPMQYGVRNIPTILFFKNGQLVDKFVGAAAKSKFQEKFDKLIEG
ncbi:MAG TPA: thioredoxin [Prevotella sp.]|nr:thioredoxin [Prevotella sp.]